MKCNKCKTEFNKDTYFCTKCGNKINIPIIILGDLLAILLYFLAIFLFLDSLTYLFEDNGLLSGILMLICSIFTCPITFRFIGKYIKYINNLSIRIIIIFFTLIIGISIAPIDEEALKQAEVQKEYEEQLKNEEDKKIEDEEQEKTNTNENINIENSNKENTIKKVDNSQINNSTSINTSFDEKMVNQFISLGFNIEEATEMQHTFYQMGIKSLSDIHSGSNNPDINGLVSYVAIANNNSKQKFYFTIENRKMFYAGFTSEDLFDSAKGGVLKNINDVHIPETKVTLDDYTKLQLLAQEEIKKYLNYPSTASFPLYDGWGVGRSDNNYKIIGNVDAKNGFGIKSTNNFSIWFIKNGDTFTVDAILINGIRVK